MLEELFVVGKVEVEYDVWLINIGEGEQFLFGFVDVNFNFKIFVLVDIIMFFEIKLFELGFIFYYLVEKFDVFILKDFV